MSIAVTTAWRTHKIVPYGRIRKLHYHRIVIVATNGAFDVLHVGHLHCLENAKIIADAEQIPHHLVVGLNSDESVRKLKGPSRPIHSQEDRAAMLAALECVDYVCIFNEPTATEFLRAVRPEIYVKSGEWTLDNLDPTERAVLDGCGARIVIIPPLPGFSTTNILEKL